MPASSSTPRWTSPSLLANPQLLDNGWRPRTPRVEIDRMATLRAGARTHWVHARDISQSGVKVESDQPIEPGTEVVLTLEGFRPVPGVVRWSAGGHCGLAFNQLIPFSELIAWLKRGLRAKRPPRRAYGGGAGSGNRTRVTSLEG